VTLSASFNADWLTIHVGDTGCGFSPSQISDGVGLSNVGSRLVSLYGEKARLSIDSHPGQGTSVSFSIPARPAKKPRVLQEAHIAREARIE
jgi:sensor histidine kinase YesM